MNFLAGLIFWRMGLTRPSYLKCNQWNLLPCEPETHQRLSVGGRGEGRRGRVFGGKWDLQWWVRFTTPNLTCHCWIRPELVPASLYCWCFSGMHMFYNSVQPPCSTSTTYATLSTLPNLPLPSESKMVAKHFAIKYTAFSLWNLLIRLWACRNCKHAQRH